VGPFIQAFRIKLQSEYIYASPLKMSGLPKALVSMIGVLALDEARAFASKVCPKIYAVGTITERSDTGYL